MDFGTYFDALERGSHHFHGTFIPANTHVSALNRIKGLYHEAANTPNSTKHRNRKARQLLARIAGLGDFILLLSVVCIPVAWMVKITATDSFIAQLQQWKVGISVTDEQDSQASSILAQYSITVQTDVSTTTDKALHAEHAPRLGTQAQEQQSDNSDANDPSSIRGADDGDGVDLDTGEVYSLTALHAINIITTGDVTDQILMTVPVVYKGAPFITIRITHGLAKKALRQSKRVM